MNHVTALAPLPQLCWLLRSLFENNLIFLFTLIQQILVLESQEFTSVSLNFVGFTLLHKTTQEWKTNCKNGTWKNAKTRYDGTILVTVNGSHTLFRVHGRLIWCYKLTGSLIRKIFFKEKTGILKVWYWNVMTCCFLQEEKTQK